MSVKILRIEYLVYLSFDKVLLSEAEGLRTNGDSNSVLVFGTLI
ncbi:hypothetical protein MNBD_GAMMA24-1566 [hydrothermal vent metagenome]|uniref:Uncharacterized protein n=1 Tax=hydrothermal vent metagenome TaxID=652676 RepID=A0A3B1BGI7_9ZZZZ